MSVTRPRQPAGDKRTRQGAVKKAQQRFVNESDTFVEEIMSIAKPFFAAVSVKSYWIAACVRHADEHEQTIYSFNPY